MPFIGSGAPLTALNASNLASGTVPTARLGSGTASSSTFLRGDQTWATPGGGGSTGLGDVGTYAVLMNVTTTNVTQGGTVAGSSLRHSWSQMPDGGLGKQSYHYQVSEFCRGWNSSVYGAPQGGTAMSGTWRKMSGGPTYATITYTNEGSGYSSTSNFHHPALYVRVS